MKKKSIFAAVCALVLLAGCTENEFLGDGGNDNGASQVRKGTIQFSDNLVDNATRASKQSSTGGTGFVAGDVMGVYGFQTIADPSLVMKIFSNTPVEKKTDSKWTYDDPRYWNEGSTYAFYGIYPQSVIHTFDDATRYFTVTDFTVENEKDDQVDLMIAKENTTSPFNTVNMVFNHILSNVNFYFKVQDKFVNSGIASYEVTNFDVTGLYSTGTYVQTGFDAGSSAVGEWTADETSVYDFPVVTSGSIAKGETLPLSDDLLLMPQTIADDATITLSYKLVYTDGTVSLMGPKTFQLNQAMGTWKNSGLQENVVSWLPNYRYNYTFAINPSVKSDPTADYDGGIGDYGVPTGIVKVIPANDPNNPTPGEDFYYVDVDNEDGDYNPDVDYPILWKDIDGDGNEEGIVDKNRDGKLDASDSFDGDGKDYNGNANDYDVILLDKDADGICESELERPGAPVPPEPIYNADWDGSVDGDDNPTGFVEKMDEDDPNNPTPGEEFWYVDIDGDGEYDPDVDYPIVWEDIDGDGKEEGIVDYNRDGKVGPEDNVDGDFTDRNGNPDDPENNPYGVDVIRIDDGTGNLIDLERDPKPDVPEGTQIDWNGSVNGDGTPSGTLVYDDINDKDTYMVDVDGDGVGDYDILWVDIDGDGKLEAVVDYNGDGVIDENDNVDGDDTNYNGDKDDNNNPFHVDVILVDEDGDGFCESELEWPGETPDPVHYGNADFDGGLNGYQVPLGNYVVTGETAYIDANRDGKFEAGVDYAILWSDIDGDGKLEGVIDYNNDGKLDANDQVDGDKVDYKGNAINPALNPYYLDVIMLDTDGDHFAETELEKDEPDIPEDTTIIEFSADVDDWIDDYDSESVLIGK